MFTTSSSQAVLTLTEVKFDLDEPGDVEVYYYLNGEELSYVPTETYSEAGIHTLSLMYPIEGLEKDRKYRFVVKMKTSSGLTIEPLSARTYVQGTGFDLTGEFDGYIEVSDDIYLIGFGYLGALGASETVTLDDSIEAVGNNISDSLNLYTIATMSIWSLSELVSILLQSLPILCEDESFLCAEDGSRLIIE